MTKAKQNISEKYVTRGFVFDSHVWIFEVVGVDVETGTAKMRLKWESDFDGKGETEAKALARAAGVKIKSTDIVEIEQGYTVYYRMPRELFMEMGEVVSAAEAEAEEF